MRRILLTLLFLAISVPAAINAKGRGAPPQAAAQTPGVGNPYYPTLTTSAEVQQFFDQGLQVIYDFNYEDATHSFKRAL